MDRRTRISILGLFGFVIMLVGTSKGPASGSGTSPWSGGGIGGEDDGGAGGSGGAEGLDDAGAMSQGDASIKPKPRDGGARSPSGAADAGAPPASGAKATSLPAPWDGMALPIGRGQVDAIRIVHPASDPKWIEKQYITSLRANGWTAARSEGDIASGMTTELTKADRRLIVRITKKDEDVVVSLNLL